ncbi:MaoC family dehydratase N-terminal domain-containing protein [Natrinema thermotolerans]|uniref:MaoC family dehydratase N-terminal domain-containing protein n=1 Tax=Natrinema thermotolerans TaxID=121872 RepID=A0AAF0T1T8_9EURY|nr:MaoC family dehydratase N-terminal domain-containing protein [Natrinema thermotolerans]ELZ09876.1 MaoC domain protein dehydratase [Natrinema thermotolerans DSM 11552]QCC60510.1 dehydratase [Natrinema thermotolerans]QCC61409.1 dehydratase [Natrinema thermotolerans]WMT07547.1 MaoC family dehydratase N-terminal domain-containing protein [Natrinema thermotolerans]WMT08179.1 MaoC family dehydratase N-terminal domain-containing protein [Natrinema thermotolerans]
MTHPTEGETRTFERTFTVDDVQRFADLTGDDQPRHTEPDDDGRVMVQGLLTATLPTKLGSDNEVLASTMEFNFHQPVYTGEPITCRSTFDTVRERDDRYEFVSDVVCENAAGETVLTAETEGLIWKDE